MTMLDGELMGGENQMRQNSNNCIFFQIHAAISNYGQMFHMFIYLFTRMLLADPGELESLVAWWYTFTTTTTTNILLRNSSIQPLVCK